MRMRNKIVQGKDGHVFEIPEDGAFLCMCLFISAQIALDKQALKETKSQNRRRDGGEQGELGRIE